MQNFTFLESVVQYLSSRSKRSRRSHVDINDDGKAEEFKVWAAATSLVRPKSYQSQRVCWNVIWGNGHKDERVWRYDGSPTFLMKWEKQVWNVNISLSGTLGLTSLRPQSLELFGGCGWGGGVGGGGGWLSRSSCPYRPQVCLLRSHSTDLTGPRQTSTASYTSSMYRPVHLPTPIVYPHDFLMLLHSSHSI